VIPDENGEGTRPQAIDSLRILAVRANPSSAYLSQLRQQEDEMQVIRSAVNASRRSRRIELKIMPEEDKPGVSWSEFENEAHRGYDIVHFSGHGGIFDDDNVLYFGDQNGEPRPVGLQEFAGALQRRGEGQGHRTLLVLLNACRSADSRQAGSVLGLAESLVSTAGIPAAIGMGYTLYEDAAVIFSQAFYSKVLEHGQVDNAVMSGRISLSNQLKDRRDWGIPRLYSRFPKGILFEWI
jgi:CHAT domain-containing protein